MAFFGLFGKKRDASNAFNEEVNRIRQQVYPGGAPEIARDAAYLRNLFGGKLTLDECKKFAVGRKTFIHITKDRSERNVVASMLRATESRISESDAREAFHYLSKDYTTLSGGEGSSKKDAVVVHAPNSQEGVMAEYKYIMAKCGEKDVDWMLVGQDLEVGDGGEHFDRLVIELKDGQTRSFWFDISEFYGRF